MSQQRPRLNKFQAELIHINKGNANFEKWVVLPDIHRPFHNKVLWDKVIRCLYDMGKSLTGVVLAGDYLDLYTLGSYNDNSLRNLRNITLGSEYADGNQGLDELDYLQCKKVYIYGNHEDRYFRTVEKGDNAKYGDALKSPTEALRLRERGYEVLENWKDDTYTVGAYLDVMHGVYTTVHSAKKHLDMTGHSCMFGHSHRVQMYRNGDKASFNIGTLCNIWDNCFGYTGRLARMQWSNGFATVIVDSNGFYYADQINIYNDKFYCNGKLY